MISRKPNFFIVGAPKCGTSAMSEYLRQHPNVFICQPKEPSYFCDDLNISVLKSEKEYLGLFRNASNQQSMIGDASTNYLISRSAIKNLSKFDKEARIVVMLRDPTEMVYAYHEEKLWWGTETEPDFKRAWALQLDRTKGERLPWHVKNPLILHYRWVGSLGQHLQRVYEYFREEQVHVILFDDFVKCPRTEYLRLLGFLGIPDDGRQEFPRVNSAKRYRFRRIGQLPKQVRRLMARPLLALQRKTNIKGTGIIGLIDKMNTERTPRKKLDPAFRRYLRDQFENETRILEQLLDRDLTAWRE